MNILSCLVISLSSGYQQGQGLPSEQVSFPQYCREAQEVQNIKWKSPSHGCICVNMDWEVNKYYKATHGGLLRDYNGAWCGGFSKYIGSCGIEVVETQGVSEGIKFAVSKGFNILEIQSNNKLVIDKFMEQ